MDVYIYRADIYCEECGLAIRARLDAEGKRPADPSDERSYDSDDYPKGPYPDGGGVADSEQFCGECGVELDNPVIGGEEDEPQEDDLTTEDYCSWYQNGKRVLWVHPDDDHIPAVKAWMDAQQFWPDAWWISDHGNAHRISLD